MDKKSKINLAVFLGIAVFLGGYFFYQANWRERSIEDGASSEFVEKNGVGAKIISQEGNSFKLRLKLENEKNDKSMKYFVSLYKMYANGEAEIETSMDMVMYDDAIIFKKDGPDFFEKDVLYEAPDFLDGKFVLMVDYTNSRGDSRGGFRIGEVSLSHKNRNFVEIYPSSCYLKIDGESIEKKYSLFQGVDVKADEKIRLFCKAKNHSGKNISLVPKVQSFYRKYHLNQKINEGVESLEAITFFTDEEKEFSLEIPKIEKPQVYDATIHFLDEQKKDVSNKVIAHYVVAGPNVSVSDVVLNKENYHSGEKAIVNLTYFGSVDNFPNSRLGGSKNIAMIAEIDLRDKDGQSCLSEMKFFSVNSSSNGEARFDLDIARECLGASLMVVVR